MIFTPENPLDAVLEAAKGRDAFRLTFCTDPCRQNALENGKSQNFASQGGATLHQIASLGILGSDSIPRSGGGSIAQFRPKSDLG
jgi:hypothetical protein